MQKLKYVEQLTYKFHYTETAYIKFVLHECETVCLFYDSWVTIFFVDNERIDRLACSIIYEKLYDLAYFLEKSLNQKNMVDEKQVPDIGLLFNKMHYQKSMLHESIEFSQLYNHVLWSAIVARDNIQTWFYSNTNGEIILFLAPIYPFFNSKHSKKNISYQEWIKTYKPVARYVIEQNIAQQWLKQARDIMNLIETNSAFRSDELAKQRMEHVQ